MFNSTNRLAVLVAALGVLAISKLNAQELNVGVLAPLSGPAAAYGSDILNGFTIAAEEINAKGGVAGRKLVLITGDDRGSPKDAANVTQKFVSDDKIPIMIGGATSTATFGAVPVAQKAGLPFLITLASHPDLTKEGNFILRNSSTQEAEGPALARLVASCLAPRSIGIMNLNNDWAIEMTRQFKRALSSTNVKILIEESYNPGENVDYASKLAKVQAANPDLIWFGSQYDDLALILKQAQRMDLGKTPLVGSAGDHTTGLIKVAGSAADGLYLHTLFLEEATTPRVKAFIDAFRAKFNAAPNLFSAQAYEGLLMVAAAVAIGNFTRTGTRDALAATKDFPGVTGNIGFDQQTREATGKKFVPIMVKDGKFVPWPDCEAKLTNAK